MINKVADKCNQKILIIGCPGTGKSTFSKILGNILDIEVIHLDKYFWKPGWTQSSREEWFEIVNKLISKDKWIIDGNYSRTFALRAERADKIFFFDYSSVLCIFRILKRTLKSKLKIEHREDLAEGCFEPWLDLDFVKFVWNFNKVIRPKMYDVIEQMNFGKNNLTIFKTRKGLKKYLKGLFA